MLTFSLLGNRCARLAWMISGIVKKETPAEAKIRVGDERLLKVSEEAGNKVR